MGLLPPSRRRGSVRDKRQRNKQHQILRIQLCSVCCTPSPRRRAFCQHFVSAPAQYRAAVLAAFECCICATHSTRHTSPTHSKARPDTTLNTALNITLKHTKTHTTIYTTIYTTHSCYKLLPCGLLRADSSFSSPSLANPAFLFALRPTFPSSIDGRCPVLWLMLVATLHLQHAVWVLGDALLLLQSCTARHPAVVFSYCLALLSGFSGFQHPRFSGLVLHLGGGLLRPADEPLLELLYRLSMIVRPVVVLSLLALPPLNDVKELVALLALFPRLIKRWFNCVLQWLPI